MVRIVASISVFVILPFYSIRCRERNISWNRLDSMSSSYMLFVMAARRVPTTRAFHYFFIGERIDFLAKFAFCNGIFDTLLIWTVSPLVSPPSPPPRCRVLEILGIPRIFPDLRHDYRCSNREFYSALFTSTIPIPTRTNLCRPLLSNPVDCCFIVLAPAFLASAQRFLLIILSLFIDLPQIRHLL